MAIYKRADESICLHGINVWGEIILQWRADYSRMASDSRISSDVRDG